MGEANVPFQIFSTPRADGRIYGLNDGGIVKSYSRIYDLGGKSGKTNGFQSVSVSPFKRSVHRSRFFLFSCDKMYATPSEVSQSRAHPRGG